MARGVVQYLVVPLVALGVFGCRVYDFAERDPWRNEAEQRCLAANPVRSSSYLEPTPEIGRGACGMTQPFKVAAIGDGTLSGAREQPAPQGFAARVRGILGPTNVAARRSAPAATAVTIEPRATLACPLIAAVDRWFLEDVQPAAIAWFGEQVVEIKQISSYACRSMNNQPGARTSEHAYGNALDVAAYRFASGREVTVKDGWRGRPEERGFLRQIHAAACGRFSTVLGPGADAFHYDHFHLDLARRSSKSVCKPLPQEVRPDPESLRIAHRAPLAPAPVPYRTAAPAPAPYAVARPSMPPPAQPDALFSNRSLAELPPSHLAPPSAPQMPPARTVYAPAQPAGDPLSLAPPRPTQVPGPASPHALPQQPQYVRPGLRPPGSIPAAGRFDPLVTGSVDTRKFYADAPAVERDLPGATPGED
jgi:hypothetical protein